MRFEKCCRMTSTAKGCVDHPSNRNRRKGRHDFVEHHRAVVERSVVLGHDRYLSLLSQSAEPVPVLSSPSEHGRPPGFLPGRARWEAGGVGAFHRVFRETAENRATGSVAGVVLSLLGQGQGRHDTD